MKKMKLNITRNRTDKSTSVTALNVKLPLHLNQSVRMLHALIESDVPVAIPSELLGVFKYLQSYFELNLIEAPDVRRWLSRVSLDHAEPNCRVGDILRPLIFPHAVVDRCRSLWSTERAIGYQFVGLMTRKRHKVFSDWLERAVPNSTVDLPSGEVCIENPRIHIQASQTGRQFPAKAWDEAYFQQLSNCRFTLCPDGDYSWTYRFFEAVLCGSIPVVETDCDVYSGFHYLHFDDAISDHADDEAWAQANYDKAKVLLTIERNLLNETLLFEAAHHTTAVT